MQGLTSVGLLHPLSPPLEYRLWKWLGGGASMWSEAVHWVCWLWCLLGGAGQVATCVLPRATKHERQSDLQTAATCAGLGGSQERPSCKPRLAAASAGAVAT